MLFSLQVYSDLRFFGQQKLNVVLRKTYHISQSLLLETFSHFSAKQKNFGFGMDPYKITYRYIVGSLVLVG